ncbi:amino acid adenylation domain-containing protein [Saccharothrix isguenensis]
MTETPQRKAAVDRVFAAAAAPGSTPTHHRSHRDGSPVPASQAQKRLWFLEVLNGPNATYNVPFLLRIDGPLDVSALWAALDDLVTRHESLRTALVGDDHDDVHQVVASPEPLPRNTLDLRRVVTTRGLPEAVGLLTAEAGEPVRLDRDRLFRATLARTGESRHHLSVVLHHAITDGWSEGLLFRELEVCYNARVRGVEPDLPPLPVQYADYSLWESGPEATALYERQLDHWRDRLAGVPDDPGLPTDHPRPVLLSGAGGTVHVDVPPDLRDRLARLGEGHEVSLFTCAVTVLAALMHRHARTDDVVIGVPVANRPLPEWEEVVGYFANSLALRVDVSGDPTWSELLTRVRAASVAALGNQNVPFDRVVDALGVPRDPSRNPVFQVMCSVNAVTAPPAFTGLDVRLTETRNETAKFDLELAVAFEPDRVSIAFDYASDLFDEVTITAFARDYRALLAALLERPRTPVSAVTMTARAHAGHTTGPDARAGTATGTGPHEPPRTATEIALAEIWSDVLHGVTVGRDTHFFRSKGDSLLATKVIARVRRRWSVRLTVRHMLQHPLLSELAAAIDAGKAEPGGARAVPALPPARPERVPLTPQQRGMWLANQLTGLNLYFHMPLAVRVTGPLDLDALADAVADLGARHEVLRSAFPLDGGQPHQVTPPGPPARPDPRPEDVTEDALPDALWDAFTEPFDLTAGPPLRARFFRVAPDTHVLMVVVHHIACDGLSWEPLCRDLETAYAARAAGRAPEWKPSAWQFADYALWRQRTLGDPDDPSSGLAEGLAYWRAALAGLPEEIDLPFDRSRPAAPTARAVTVPLELGADLYQAVVDVAVTHRSSVYMVLQAATAVLLTRMGAGTDIPVGSPAAGRADPAFDDLVGCFVDMVVLRTDTSGDPTFTDLLDRVRESDVAAYGHQHIPFDRVVDAVGATRRPGRNPLFQVLVSLNNRPDPWPRLAGTVTESIDVDEPVTPFDLAADFTEDRDRGVLTGTLTAAADLFDAATVVSLADRLVRVLTAVVTHPDRPIGAVDVLTADERAQLLGQWAGPPSAEPRVTLAGMVANAAARTPDAVALAAGGESMTYAELDARATALAVRLRAEGVEVGGTVAFMLPRGFDLYVTVVAIAKAGAGLLPLDPRFPPDRIAYVLADASADLVLTRSDTDATVPTGGPARLVLDRLDLPPADGRDLPDVDPALPAYILYTSGSTGMPKGVVVPHTGLSALGEHNRRLSRIRPGSRVLQQATPTFDLFVEEVVDAFHAGATLVIAPPKVLAGRELFDVLVEERISHVTLIPTVAATLPAGELPDLRVLMFGGEVLPGPLVDRWAVDRVVTNSYGPTEATVTATTTDPLAPGTTPTIGKAILGSRVYVLDGDGGLVPPGVAGEVHIAGVGLAHGYLNRHALTAEAFVPCPFGEPGERMYRTGDLARWTAAGELDFLGRADDQVKIRGIRMELGEIESVLRSHPDVALAVVTAHPNGRLIGYVRPAGRSRPDPVAVREHVASRVPQYMVPSVVVVVDEFPMLASGKVDRAALPVPADLGTGDHVPPETPTEHALVGIWSALFPSARLGVGDDFFALGGHSLTAVQMLAEIRSDLGVAVPLSQCFANPTIRELALVVDSRRAAAVEEEPPIVRRRRP